MPAPSTVVVNAKAHPLNALQWCGDRLALVGQASAHLIIVAPDSLVTRSQEIAPISSDFGTVQCVCEDEDAVSLAENSYPRFVDLAYSPRGVGRHRSRVIALLTADHRCAIFGSTKNPDCDPWQLQHPLLLANMDRLGLAGNSVVQDISSIRRLRINSIAWTQPYFHASARWGESFLVMANQFGEIQLLSIYEDRQTLVFMKKYSDASITMIRLSSWSKHGTLTIFVVDISGAIIVINLTISCINGQLMFDEGDTKILPSKNSGLVSNMTCKRRQDDSIMLAVATPGRIRVFTILENNADSECVQYMLPLYGTVCSLSWAHLTDVDAGLYIFGSKSANIVLVFDYAKQSLDVHQHFQNTMNRFATDRLAAQGASFAELGAVQAAYSGAAVSPGQVHLAVSYSYVPVNVVEYKISSNHITQVEILPISDDPEKALRSLLLEFIDNPYSISLTTLLSLYKISDTSIMASLNALSAQGHERSHSDDGPSTDLAASFFREASMNRHRLVLASSAAETDSAMSTERSLRTHLVKCVLSLAQSERPSIGPQGARLVSRYISYTRQFLQDDSSLMTLISRVAETFSGSESEADLCPACAAPVSLTESMIKGHCSKGHHWIRCSITLAILSDLDARTCLTCNRKVVSMRSDTIEAGLYSVLLDACDMCYYCTGAWHCKLG